VLNFTGSSAPDVDASGRAYSDPQTCTYSDSPGASPISGGLLRPHGDDGEAEAVHGARRAHAQRVPAPTARRVRTLSVRIGSSRSGSRITPDLGSPATSRPRQGDDDAALSAANKSISGSVAATSTSGTGSGSSNRPMKSSRPIWLLRRQRSHWTYDGSHGSHGSLESCSTDA